MARTERGGSSRARFRARRGGAPPRWWCGAPASPARASLAGSAPRTAGARRRSPSLCATRLAGASGARSRATRAPPERRGAPLRGHERRAAPARMEPRRRCGAEHRPTFSASTAAGPWAQSAEAIIGGHETSSVAALPLASPPSFGHQVDHVRVAHIEPLRGHLGAACIRQGGERRSRQLRALHVTGRERSDDTGRQRARDVHAMRCDGTQRLRRTILLTNRPLNRPRGRSMFTISLFRRRDSNPD